MFSPSIRSAFTATTFVLAIAASTSLSAARSDNYGSGQGHDRKNRDAANRPITVLPAPPGSGSNDPLIGNLGSIGSNPGGSVVPGNNGGDNHAVAARSGSNDGGQGHGKKNPVSPTAPTIIQPASPGSGSNDHLIGNLGSIGSDPGGSVVPGNNGGDNHAAAARAAVMPDPTFLRPSTSLFGAGISTRIIAAASLDRSAFGRQAIAAAPVVAPALLPRILDRTSLRVSRDGERGLEAGGAWTLAF